MSMSDKGFIKLHRSLIDWEWWDDHNAVRLLVYLLVSVNWETKKWKGVLVEKGSIITSWENLSIKLGLSKQQVRTAMAKLESSKEVTRKPTNKYQLIKLNKWDKLQFIENDNTQNNRQVTGKQHSNNTQITPTKEVKEYKEEEEYKEKSMIPTQLEVEKYFLDNGYSTDGAKRAFDYYQTSIEGKPRSKYWKDSKGNPVKNWKQKMRAVWFKDEFKTKTNGVEYHPGTNIPKNKIIQ